MKDSPELKKLFEIAAKNVERRVRAGAVMIDSPQVHITLDEKRRSAFKNGQEVELTMKEFDLMLFLMKNPGKVLSREKLLDLVWGYDYLGDTRTVDVHIRRLREKLELNPAQPEYIITKWGVGYYFAD